MLAAWTVATLASCVVQDASSREQMEADLRQLALAVREHWSYLELRRETASLDLDGLLAESLAALEGVSTQGEFARVLRRFVARLQDGHADLAIETGEPDEGYLLLELADCVEGLVVTAAGEGSAIEPEARTPRRGERLIAIDGVLVAERLRELERLVFASTPGQRRALAVEALLRTASDRVELELEEPAGESHRVVVRPRAWPHVSEVREDNWSLTWSEEGVARLRVDSFAVVDWEAWLKAGVDEREPFLRDTYRRIEQIFAELDQRAARALILDLRGNGGGTDLLAIHLAKHLLAEPFVFFRLSSRSSGAWNEPGGLTYRIDEGLKPFHGPVVALIDEGCFSVTDNLLRCLSDLHPRFTTVGRASGGGTGAPRYLDPLQHTGARVRLCTMRVLGPRSGPIEGQGTQAVVSVHWTRADVLEDRDPDLAAALRVLAE